MEAVPGVPVKRKLKLMMEQWATSQGKTVDEAMEDMKKDLEDPEKLRALLAAKPPSESMVSLWIWLVRTIDWMSNGARFTYNMSVGQVLGSRLEYQWSEAPLNGPHIIKLLCEVHAHQVFVDGLYNSDPHAGNVIVMPDGRLGLIDYGAAARITIPQRMALAKLLVAISDKDDDAIIKYCAEFGLRSKNLDRTFMLGYAFICFHRGFNPDDMLHAGIPPEVSILELDMFMNKLDKWEAFDGHVATMQRLMMVLLGMATDIGASGISMADLWKVPAQAFLDSHKYLEESH